jgi:serine/threonine protein kinase
MECDGGRQVTTIWGAFGGEGTRYEAARRPFGRCEAPSAVDVVVGPYRVLEVLGEGASSRVFVAEHLEDGRRVALKLMLPCHGDSLTKVMRFTLEAELLERLKHPNIVRIIERGIANERYVALELLNGETLRDRLVRESVLSLRDSLQIATQVASALEAVHAAGIIHCDLKPDNLHLSPTGPIGGNDVAVKLYDFDAARWIDKGTGRSTAILPHGAILGTPGYMAPEQETGALVDHRADIYAFGVVMYEMLTSAAPYGQTTSFSDMVRTKFFGTPKPLRAFRHLNELPPAVDDLVRSCIERIPEKRPNDMAEVSAMLRDVALDLEDSVGEAGNVDGRVAA